MNLTSIQYLSSNAVYHQTVNKALLANKETIFTHHTLKVWYYQHFKELNAFGELAWCRIQGVDIVKKLSFLFMIIHTWRSTLIMNTSCERDPPSSRIKLHFTPLFGLSYSFLYVNILDWPFYQLFLNIFKLVSICDQKAEVARGLELARHTWKPDRA